MHVSIAGSGDMARYFSEEFTRAGHRVTVLTRSMKPYLAMPNVVQKVTDYTSVSSIVDALSDSEILVSAILDYSHTFTDVHIALIKACTRSPKCKRFIPAEYGGNLEEYPDQPGFYYRNHEPIRKMLREQRDLEWTLVSVGWLIDYVLPAKNRYLKNAGSAFPVDLEKNQILIPGTGKEPVDVTSARDAAKGVAVLLDAPDWEPYTYMSGQRTTWREVTDIMQKRHPDMIIQYKSLGQLIDDFCSAKDEVSRIIAEYQIFSASHAGSFDQAKVKAHRVKYFNGIHFRSVPELLDEVDKDPTIIV